MANTETTERAKLDEILARSKAWWDSATQEQKAEVVMQQRRSFVIAEAGFGSDQDAAAYLNALAAGDAAAIERLNADSKARQQLARDWLEQNGL